MDSLFSVPCFLTDNSSTSEIMYGSCVIYNIGWNPYLIQRWPVENGLPKRCLVKNHGPFMVWMWMNQLFFCHGQVSGSNPIEQLRVKSFGKAECEAGCDQIPVAIKAGTISGITLGTKLSVVNFHADRVRGCKLGLSDLFWFIRGQSCEPPERVFPVRRALHHGEMCNTDNLSDSFLVSTS